MSTTTLTGPFDDQLSQRLLFQRIVVLGQEVDDAVAHRITAQLLLLSADDPRADTTLYVNSPGGSVTAGLAIHVTVRLVPDDVSTLVMGMAASTGQFLLCAGTAGKRHALPHARVTMHQPSGGIGGTAADIAIQAENLEHTRTVLTRLTAQHTGQDEATIRQDSERDRWFTAEQAREHGMVDHVVTGVSDVRLGTAREVGW